MHTSGETVAYHDRSHGYWRIVMAGVPAGLVFGTWGYMIYGWETGEHAAFLNSLYHAVGLFALHMPPLEGRVNLPLELGRWAAATTSGLAAVLVLRRVFLTEWRHFSLRWAAGHVVICGLGEVGTRLALEFARAGFKVVAIERDTRNPAVAEVEQHGVVVVPGDARDTAILRGVGVARARNVLAVCTEDDTNIAIAVAARELAPGTIASASAPECLLFVTDPLLRRELALHPPEPAVPSRLRLKVGGLDVPDVVARRAFEEHPLDFDGITEGSAARVHLVVIGTCTMAEAVAVKALQLGHYANRQRPLLTVMGPDAQGFVKRLRQHHPQVAPWYDPVAVEHDPSAPGLVEAAVAVLSREQFVTIAICSGCDEPGKSTTAEARRLVHARKLARALRRSGFDKTGRGYIQVLVHLRQNAGFNALLTAAVKAGEGVPVHAFGLVETFCNRATLLHEEQDAVARALHDDYQKRHGGDDWDKLTEEMRDSNRQAADHVPIKLRAVGMRIADQGGVADTAVTSLFCKPVAADGTLDPRIMLLAEMEHSRWCAERWLAGWRCGEPRDRQKKVNPDLVPWVALAREERMKDPEQVLTLPSALARIGKQIAVASAPPVQATAGGP